MKHIRYFLHGLWIVGLFALVLLLLSWITMLMFNHPVLFGVVIGAVIVYSLGRDFVKASSA